MIKRTKKLVTNYCTECGAPVQSTTGRRTVCGTQAIYNSCAWKKQRKYARKNYDLRESSLKHNKPKRKPPQEDDWCCDYTCNF